MVKDDERQRSQQLSSANEGRENQAVSTVERCCALTGLRVLGTHHPLQLVYCMCQGLGIRPWENQAVSTVWNRREKQGEREARAYRPSLLLLLSRLKPCISSNPKNNFLTFSVCIVNEMTDCIAS